MRSVTLRAAIALSAAAALVAACGFSGSAAHDGPTDDGPRSDAPSIATEGGAGDGPDGAPRVGCSWPSLQAGAPWPMIGGCVTHAGRSSFRGPRIKPREVWQADISAYGPVPSIAADDTIYVPADNDGILAFRPDGTSKKLDVGGGDVTNTPAIGRDGTLFFGAGNNLVRRAPDGKNERYDVSGETDSSAILDADGNVYIASFANKLVSYDPQGNRRWELPTGAGVNSSPAIGASGDIYIGTLDAKLLAVNPKDGTLRWTYVAGPGNEIESSPVVADDGTIYIGTRAGRLHAVSPTGALMWTWQTPGPFRWQMLPALGWDGIIYAATERLVVALRPSGTLLWQLSLEHTVRSQVIVDVDGIVYVGADDPGESHLYAISPLGQLLWDANVQDPPTGFAIGRDGTIYVTCDTTDRIHALHE